MRLLIFLLALMSAFFLSAAEQDLVPAKEVKSNGLCKFGGDILSDDIGFFECSELVRAELGMSYLGEAWQDRNSST